MIMLDELDNDDKLDELSDESDDRLEIDDDETLDADKLDRLLLEDSSADANGRRIAPDGNMPGDLSGLSAGLPTCERMLPPAQSSPNDAPINGQYASNEPGRIESGDTPSPSCATSSSESATFQIAA